MPLVNGHLRTNADSIIDDSARRNGGSKKVNENVIEI